MSIIIKDTSNGEPSPYTYRDISLGRFSHNQTSTEVEDIQSIKSSIHNILTIKKGARIRSPHFGSNLTDYLFQPISETGGQSLGEDLERVLLQEPRIHVQDIIVEVDAVGGQYILTVLFTIPTISDELVALEINGNSDTGFSLGT